jgi:pimeloyl-ACP methyl ester carboxylesterase
MNRALLVAVVVLLLAGCSSAPSAPAAPESTLPALAPSLALESPRFTPTREVAPLDQLAAQEVRIPGAEGLVVVGDFYPAAAPGPGVLLLHMYGGSRSDWGSFALDLQRAGFASLAIDLRGHGATGGGEDWSLASDDVAMAYAWLGAQEGVDADRLALVGASIGANLALVEAARDETVGSLALLSPGFDYFRVRIQGLIEEYGERPALLVASEEDAYSAETVRALAASAPGEAELIMLTSAGHGTAMLERDPELAGDLIVFLNRALGPGS